MNFDVEYDVIVCGGGFAGMNAYIRLSNAGFKVLLIEQRDYLGGRARSFFSNNLNEEIDNGQHLMLGCYYHTFQFLKLLTDKQQFENFDDNTINFNDGNNIYKLKKTKLLPFRIASLVGLLNFKVFNLSDKYFLMKFILNVFSHKPPDHETVSEYLTRFNQSEKTIKYFWSPLVIATLNTSIEKASAIVFHKVLKVGFLGKGNASELLFAKTNLDSLFSNINNKQETKSKILCGVGINFINKIPHILNKNVDSNHGNIINNIFEITLKNGTQFYSQKIISALPNDVFIRVTKESNLKKDFELSIDSLSIQPMEFSPIVSVYLKFKNQINIPEITAMINSRLEWVFNLRKMKNSNHENGLITCTVSNADDLIEFKNEQIFEVTRNELMTYFPNLQKENIIGYEVVKEKRATPIFSPLTNKSRPDIKTSIDNFYICGDWVNTGLPATIESACYSGFLASELILKNNTN